MRGSRGWLLAAAMLAGTPGLAQAVSPQTRAANAAVLKGLPADDGQDADFAARGFLGTHPAPSRRRPPRASIAAARASRSCGAGCRRNW